MGLSFVERLSSYLSTLPWDIIGAVATALATIFALVAIIVSAHYSKEAAIAQKRSIDISLLDKRNDIVAYTDKEFGKPQELRALKAVSESVRILFSDDVFMEFLAYLHFLSTFEQLKNDRSSLSSNLRFVKSEHRSIDKFLDEEVNFYNPEKWVHVLYNYMSSDIEETVKKFGVTMTFYDDMKRYLGLLDKEEELEREHQRKHDSLVLEIKNEIYYTIKN